MERAAWERLVDEGENTVQYRYFSEYRDTAPENRSIDALCDKFGVGEETMSSYRWKFHWDKRVEKFDDFVDKEARRKGLIKAEKIRLASLSLSERMLEFAEQKMSSMKFNELTAKETREYIKAAVALAEVFKDDNSKQRDYLDSEDTSAEVVIYLPEIDDGGEVG